MSNLPGGGPGCDPECAPPPLQQPVGGARPDGGQAVLVGAALAQQAQVLGRARGLRVLAEEVQQGVQVGAQGGPPLGPQRLQAGARQGGAPLDAVT